MPKRQRLDTAAQMRLAVLAVLARMELIARGNAEKHGQRPSASMYAQRLVTIADVRHAVEKL